MKNYELKIATRLYYEFIELNTLQREKLIKDFKLEEEFYMADKLENFCVTKLCATKFGLDIEESLYALMNSELHLFINWLDNILCVREVDQDAKNKFNKQLTLT